MDLTLLIIFATCLGMAFAQAPILSSNDPFYNAPDNIGSYPPGQLIRNRTVSPELSTLSGIHEVDIGSFQQYLYRTTDSLGNPVAAVTSLLVLKKPEQNERNKLLVYSTAYDSANNDCSPSYQ